MTAGPEYAFVTAAPLLSDGAVKTSPSAVARARTLGPVLALNSLGYDARAYSLSGTDDLPATLQNSKAIVLNGSCSHLLQRLEGAKVVLDFIAPPSLLASAHEQAAAMTAGSEYVAQRLRSLSKRPVEVIAEPCAGFAADPRATGPRRHSKALQWLAARAGVAADAWRMRLLWTGEGDDIASIAELSPGLERLGREIPLALRCLCPSGAALDALANRLREEDPEALRLTLEAWSPGTLAHALAGCDLALLPGQAPADSIRLSAALHAGRFPVCHPSPYYGALGEFAWVGNDLAEGIRWALSHPEDVLGRLGRARDYVARVHAPATVARDWIRIFLKIA